MRKLLVLVVAALLAAPSIASAAVLDHSDSWLVSKIGGLQRQDVQGVNDGSGTQAVLTGAAGSESLALNGATPLFGTNNASPGSALFTGVANISNLFLTVQNGIGTFVPGFSGTWVQGALGSAFGGVAGQTGSNQIELLGGVAVIPTPLGVVGAGGQTTVTIGLLTATIFVDGAPWVTSEVAITGILTNIISITNGTRAGATGIPFSLSATINESTTVITENGVSQVKIEGTDSLSGTAPGQVTLVSPTYIDAGSATGRGPIPGASFMQIVFVPEPGSMLLLGSAVAGLLVVGRKRMQR